MFGETQAQQETLQLRAPTRPAQTLTTRLAASSAPSVSLLPLPSASAWVWVSGSSLACLSAQLNPLHSASCQWEHP